MAVKRKSKRRRKSLNKEIRAQVAGVLLLAVAVFSYTSLVQTGQTGGIGAFTSNLGRMLVGEAALAIPFIVAIIALRLFLPLGALISKPRLFALLGIILIFMIWTHLQLMVDRIADLSASNVSRDIWMLGVGQEGGGVIGAAFAVILHYLLGITGSRIVLTALALIALMRLINVSITRIINAVFNLGKQLIGLLVSLERKVCRFFENIYSGLKKQPVQVSDHVMVDREADTPDDHYRIIAAVNENAPAINGREQLLPVSGVERKENQPLVVIQGQSDHEIFEQPVIPVKSLRDHQNYMLPVLDLLFKPSSMSDSLHLKNSKERAKLLESTLLSFGVKAKVVHVQSGPTVTRFEVQPEAGVKVSRIISLSDDLALNLKAPLVRIEAPIPGKAALGIEVPNNIVTLVYLREVLEDQAFKGSFSPLTVALGKDITGSPVVADLTKMPHILIAGATGAGKSVCLNTVITSILYKSGPDQTRFLMIDPKVVELSIYNGIPHLLMPVLTDPRKASLALRNMVKEMGRRYDQFASLGVRDIAAYNELLATEEDLERLPYIVVVIDELADLMMVSPGDVEDAIARLAQMSRAAGIHLVVATQRPSVDVLTGVIKANMTSRIAFTVSSQFDSRTILDMAGAEKLLGRGDMLFYPVGTVKPFRVQGAYISEAEVKRVTDFIKEQGRVDCGNGSAYLDTPEDVDAEEMDALFTEAIDLVVRTGQASISLLQRRFRIGYTRAARLIDDLERRGIVGQFEGSKPREVLVTPEQAAQICEDFKKHMG
ncbi:MAG TPA: DNA translocase FtsK 4TM domain-containing protein [Candidatus Limnocylindrales bacterium]|nr:DNA translocase FtsK 4TM domain-containing protein [Candidatus Limnocylindrales bacterium]